MIDGGCSAGVDATEPLGGPAGGGAELIVVAAGCCTGAGAPRASVLGVVGLRRKQPTKVTSTRHTLIVIRRINSSRSFPGTGQ